MLHNSVQPPRGAIGTWTPDWLRTLDTGGCNVCLIDVVESMSTRVNGGQTSGLSMRRNENYSISGNQLADPFRHRPYDPSVGWRLNFHTGSLGVFYVFHFHPIDAYAEGRYQTRSLLDYIDIVFCSLEKSPLEVSSIYSITNYFLSSTCSRLSWNLPRWGSLHTWAPSARSSS